MSKIFRLHKTGSTSEDDWFTSQPISDQIIDEIVINDKTKGQKLPTSIPSPFARLDLVRMAFDIVNAGDLDGDSDYHKLISDSLDIAQLFFYSDFHPKDLKIESWDPAKDLQKLLDSNNAGHLLFGETLKLYLLQDQKTFNFSLEQRIFILKYRNKVIGGTSPSTLFFASPFNQSAFPVKIQVFGNHDLLGQDIQALYRRAPKFVEFYYHFFNSITDNSEKLPSISKYIEKNLNKLRNNDFEFYSNLTSQDSQSYLQNLTSLNTSTGSNDVIEIFGHEVKKAEVKSSDIQSDFKIDSDIKITFNNTSVTPLVLPTSLFSKRINYVDDTQWDPQRNMLAQPHYDLPPAQRSLPSANIKYPFFTASDFLEDFLIQLPYAINSKHFYSPHQQNKFLLPLKRAFTNCISVERIINDNLINFKELSSGIEVTLRVPINSGKDHIEYKKTYFKRNQQNLTENDKVSNKGIIKNLSIGMYINTPVSLIDQNSSDVVKFRYSVGLYDKSKLNTDIISLNFFNKDSKIESQTKTRLFKKKKIDVGTQHYSIEDSFDSIRIKVDEWDTEALLICTFQKYSPNNSNLHFGVDFGTTNTHIEIKEGENLIPFSYSSKDQSNNGIVAFLRDPRFAIESKDLDSEEGEDYLLHESLPLSLSKDSEYSLPTRSCLFINKGLDFNTENILFGDLNIGFDYEKKRVKSHLDVETNLKWDDNHEGVANEKQISSFIEQLVLMIKSKVLLSNNNLEGTKITWTYPVSLPTYRLNLFKRIWNEKYQQHIDKNLNNISPVPESISPFYFYVKQQRLQAINKPTVSIDLGGGTCDVVAFFNNEPKIITSLKFGGDSLYGDAYGGSIVNNGFVLAIRNKVQQILRANGLSEIQGIEQKLSQQQRNSKDYINFLFSLDRTIEFSHPNLNIKFAKMIAEDTRLMLVYLLYYSAIFYYIAQLLKGEGITMPDKFIFSGTGSKRIKLIDEHLFKSLIGKILSYVFDEKEPSLIQIISSDEPKEITSKGSLSADLNVDYTSLIRFWAGGHSNDRLNRVFKTNSSSENIRYNEIEESDLKSIEKSVKEFFDLFNNLVDDLSLTKDHGVPLHAQECIRNLNEEFDINAYIKQGFSERKKEVKNQQEFLDTSLFFYGLIGVINELSYKIVATNDDGE